MDIKALREEYAQLHAENKALLEKNGGKFSAEDKEISDRKYARMDEIKASVEASQKLAAYAYSADEADKGEQPKGKVEFEKAVSGKREFSAAEIRAGVNEFALTGSVRDRDLFATNQLAIKMAPFIQALADKLTDFATSGDGMAIKVVNAFESVVKGIATAADYLSALKAGFYLLQSGATLALYGILKPTSLVIDAVQWLTNKLTGRNDDIGKGFRDGVDALAGDAKAAFDKAGESYDDFVNSKNSKAAGRVFDDIRSSAQKAAEATAKVKEHLGGTAIELDHNADSVKKIQDTLDGLDKQIRQFNMTKGEKTADDLMNLGASPEQVKQAEQLQDQLDKLEELKKAHEELANSAKQVYEQTRTPLEKYNDELDKLDELLEEGMIDQETYDRAAQQAQDKLDKDTKPKEVKLEAPGALTAGSGEAANFIAQMQADQRGRDITKSHYEEAKRQTRYLKDIADNKGGDGDLAVAQF